MRKPTSHLAAAVVISVFASACGGDDVGPTPADQLDPGSDAGRAYQVVLDTYAAYNSGEAARWVELRDRGSRWPSEATRVDGLQVEVEFVRAEHALGSRLASSGCTSHGLSDWPDVADVGLATGYYFTCEMVLTDAIGDAGGLELPESFNWVVSDGDVVAVNSESPEDADRAWGEWASTFLGWLETTHPAAWRGMTFVGYDGEDSFPSAESIPTALRYLDEFVDIQP